MNKPGFKTTEFWLSIAAMLVGALLSSGAISHDPTLQVLGFISSTLAALGYTAGRSFVKGSEAKAEAIKVAAKSGN